MYPQRIVDYRFLKPVVYKFNRGNRVKVFCFGRSVNFTTGSCPPHAPGLPQASGSTSDSLSLEWSAPAHDGGASIESYILQLSEGAPPRLSPIPPLHVTNPRGGEEVGVFLGTLGQEIQTLRLFFRSLRSLC